MPATYPRLPADFRSRYGPVAVVTGATSGIGREAASHLAEAGFDLVLVARRRSELESLAMHLAMSRRVGCEVVDSDLGDAGGVRRVIEATSGRDVGLLVAAAGFGASGDLVHSPLDEQLAMVDVNCRATLALAHEFGMRFAQRGRGGLVLMSSLLAFQGVPRAANYAATKAYVQVLAEGLARELAPHGVDVLASAPGPVDTGFAKRADMVMSMALAPGPVALGMLRALGRRTTVRPGWLSKLLEWSLAPLPRAARVRILERVMGGMTAHQPPRAVCHDSKPHAPPPQERDRDARGARPA